MESLKKLNELLDNLKARNPERLVLNEPAVNDNLPRPREVRALVALFGDRAFSFAWKRGTPINEVTDGEITVAFTVGSRGELSVYDVNVSPSEGNGYLGTFLAGRRV
jgi:hypothetical protein